mgnify:CR=1 FL=1
MTSLMKQNKLKMKHVKLFEQFVNESINEAAKDLRFKYVIGKDFKNHGVVDFVKGDKLYVEIDAEGNTVPYSSDDVYVLNDEDTETLRNAMIKGKLKPNASPKELESFIILLLTYESVVNEAKNTIGLAFKDKDDYSDFVKFCKDEGVKIRKDLGEDKKTKSWSVEMDVKELEELYGEITPGNKNSGWLSIKDDFDSVIIESVNEGYVNEGYAGKFPKDITLAKTKKVAEEVAKAMNMIAKPGETYSVNPETIDDASFDLDVDYDGDFIEYDGGSYNLYDDGAIVNMATWDRKTGDSPVFGDWRKDNARKIAANIKKML